jgi:O-antigen/teichoic acid export membrane protein
MVTLRLALGVPVTIVATVACLWVSDSDAMRVAAVLICAVHLIGAVGALRAVFQVQVRNAVPSALEVANGVVWGGCVLLAWQLDGGLVALAAAFLVVTTLTNLTMAALALRAAPVRFRGVRRNWGPLLRLGVPIGIGGVLTLGYGYVDQVIVFQVAGAEEAGLYGAVYRIFVRLQLLPAAVMTTLFPLLVAARHSDPQRARRLFGLAIDYLVMMSLPAFAISLAGPTELVELLFGKEFSRSAPALPVLMATLVVVSLGYLAGYMIIAYELQRRFVVIAFVALVVNVTANLLLVPPYGFMAAAWITLGTEVLVVGCTLTLVGRRVGRPPAGLRVGRVLLAAVAMWGLAYGLRRAGSPLAVWATAGALAYPALLLALRAVSLDEVRALLRRRAEPAA